MSDAPTHVAMSAARRSALTLSMLVLAAAHPALAQDGNSRDDRFTLRLSAFNPGADLGFDTNGEALSDGTTRPFDETATLDTGDEWRPRGAVSFRFSDRQSIGASYYDYENDDSRALSFGARMFDPGPPRAPVELPATQGDGRIKFTMASAHYEYAVIATPAFEWGLGIGATYVDLEVVADIAWDDSADFDAGTARLSDGLSGWSPAVHTRLTWRPADRWRVDLEGQFLDADWGNLLDEGGHFERAGVVVEYLITERIGVHVGYDWFRLKVRDRVTDRFVPPPDSDFGVVDYAANVRGELKVHGPLAGLTIRF